MYILTRKWPQNKRYDIIDMLMAIYTIPIHQSFIHDYNYTANCLLDSQSPTHRRPVADQSPTSCRPVATHFQSVGNQSPTSRRPVADWSLIFRDRCRRPVADWSATEKMQFWSHSGCIGCSCFLVARQSPTGCSACVTGALRDNGSLLTNHASTPPMGKFLSCSKSFPPRAPPADPTALISWRGIALGFPKPQCRRSSPILVIFPAITLFWWPPHLAMAPSSGTILIWRHNQVVVMTQ